MKGGIGLMREKKRFWSLLILLLAVYKEKIVKNDKKPKNVVPIQIQKDATYDLHVKKSI